MEETLKTSAEELAGMLLDVNGRLALDAGWTSFKKGEKVWHIDDWGYVTDETMMLAVGENMRLLGAYALTFAGAPDTRKGTLALEWYNGGNLPELDAYVDEVLDKPWTLGCGRTFGWTYWE